MIRIEVTAEDIEQGVRNDCSFCPVARAIYRALNNPDCVVFVTSRCVTGNNGFAELPDSAQSAIESFDRFGCMEPFDFELELEV